MLEYLVIAGGFVSFLLAMGVGANDVANSFATSVGAKVLTLKQALVIASICECGGALLLGSHVMNTMRKGIGNINCYEDNPETLMYGMFSVLIGVSMWLAIATYGGYPVSTTHSCVGGITGMIIATKGSQCIIWTAGPLKGLSGILLSWLFSPLLSGIAAASIFALLRFFILTSTNSFQRAKKLYPLILFSTFLINSFFIIYKGGKGLGVAKISITTSSLYAVSIAGGLTIIITPVIWGYLREDTEKTQRQLELTDIERVSAPPLSKDIQVIEEYPTETEQIFRYLQIFTAICESFAHGANDVANAVGPYAALYLIGQSEGIIGNKNEMGLNSYWILGIGGAGISIGLLLFGKKMIMILGEKACKLTPSRGFSIEMASTSIILVGSRLGIPLSTTHCQVGATYAIGLFDYKNNVNWVLFRKIIFGWFITLIVTGLLSGFISIGILHFVE